MNFLFKSLIALVVLAPLPMGSVAMWAWSLLALLVALMLATWGTLTLIARQGPPVPLIRIWPAAVLFGIAILWAAIQTAPWTPAEWHHPLWADAGRVLGTDLSGRVSLNPFEGGSAILRLLAYGGVFWLALQLCRDRNRAQAALRAIAIAGAVYATYGIAVYISGTETILWFKKTHYLDVLTSTFVNRNSYATYAGLGLLATSVCLIDLVEKRLARSSSRAETVRKIIVALTTEGRYLVAGWVALLTAVLLTESRGGTIATIFGMVVLFTALQFRQNAAKARTRAMVLSLSASLLVLIAVSGGNVADRLAETASHTGIREVLYADTARALADHAVLGSGYGAFPDTFRMYQDATIVLPVERAHNTYLENALEFGLPAAAALFLSVGVLGILCLAGIARRRRDSIYPCLGVAVIALGAVHSLFDFSLQLPAVAILFAFLLGLGCAQSWNTQRSSGAAS